jgi:DNA-directed RNA polymerase specialized sigma24 family protein
MQNEAVTPYEALDDASLVARCLAADEAAWSEIVRRYGRLVYSSAVRAVSDPDIASDVFQAVFVRLLASLESLRTCERLDEWLVRVTPREASRVVDMQRRRDVRREGLRSRVRELADHSA